MMCHIKKTPDWIIHCLVNTVVISMAMCVFLPLGSVSKTFGFGSSCLLFANMTVNIKDNQSVFIEYKRTWWGDIHYCYYTTFMPVVVAIHCFIWTWFFIHLKRTITDGEFAGVMTVVIALFDFVLFVCMLVSSCLVSRGFIWWCRELSFSIGTSKSFRCSCEHIDALQWKPNSRKYSIYSYLTLAEVSGWLLTLLLGFQVSYVLYRGYKTIVCSPDDKPGINNAMYGPFSDTEICTDTGSNMADLTQFTLPNDTGVCLLECTTAFSGLTEKEKLYSHYISQAAFTGGLIVLLQTSPESPGIFLLLQKVFRSQSVSDLEKTALDNGISAEEFQALLIYAAGFYSNMGNYKSFGDSKFVPKILKEKFQLVIMNSTAAKEDPTTIQEFWTRISDRMYSLDERQRELGLGEKGTTTYFSENCDKRDAEIVQEFLNKMDISAYNTRLFKTTDTNNLPKYEIRLASAETADNGDIPGYDSQILGEHTFSPADVAAPVKFTVTRGDYSELMKGVCENLAMAKKYAANATEVQMLDEYIKSFTTGSLPAHKDGSRLWIKNKSPVVETYIGFIESYRDPYGVRGEFEGFVAVVNKDMSMKFGKLVENAEHLLAHLPWPAEYEKDTFLRPDFTSLDVLAFGGSGIPAGINIPNYDEIRQNEGFKNVSLGNVLTAGYKDTKVTFLSDQDKELYIKLKLPAFEVQVGLHELLGHGSGKLFIKKKDGSFNFDTEAVKHTETGEKISKWYESNETWDSKFSTVAATYEECRAECVGLYLCLSTEVLKIFGHTHDDADDIIYINWLNMVRAGLLALEFYSPESSKWNQAHMNARYVILRVLLEAGDDFVKVEETVGEDGNPDLRISLDRTKINSVGKPAIGKFLRKLQVYKSTGDNESGSAMYKFYSDVNNTSEPHFLSLRTIVLARKQPRKLFVQHTTKVNGESVDIKSYEASAAGLIQSFADRFPSTDVDDILQNLWDRDQHHF